MTLNAFITELKKTSSKEECLKKAYDVLSSRYRGYRSRTYLYFWLLMTASMERLWKKEHYLPCTKINQLLKHVLLKSGKFLPEDIQLKWTLIWDISPHEYARVNVGSRWINVDIWSKVYGIPYGDYAHSDHSGTVYAGS